jgi:hypothetical protein
VTQKRSVYSRWVIALFAPLAALALVSTAPKEPLLSEARPAQQGNLRFSVASETLGSTLKIKPSIRNKSTVIVRVGYGSCAHHNVTIRLYRTPERIPPAVWESPLSARVGPPLVFCTDVLIVEAIPPGGSVVSGPFAGEVSGLGLPDSVPAGTYYVIANIRLATVPVIESGEMAAGTIVVEHR